MSLSRNCNTLIEHLRLSRPWKVQLPQLSEIDALRSFSGTLHDSLLGW
jgi:hypothetical protein